MNLSIIALAGFVGTSTMLAVMSVLHTLKLANADMVRAIGSLYTRSIKGSLIPGLIIHYSVGLFFAFLYAKLLGILPITTVGSITIVSTFLGFVHGIIVGLALEVRVAVYHPVPEFKKVGFAVVVAHIVGHIAYGLSVGIVYAQFLDQMPFRPIMGLQ
ncbi:MAG: hypothetical protein ABIQ95_08150 [Bdellovibrionia bacterium]